MSRNVASAGPTIVTVTRVNFVYSMDDVAELLRQHDACTNRKVGRPLPRLEVLKRAAVILAVTAWESFIEDSIRNRATSNIESASHPSDVRSLFNSVAQGWLEGKPKPTDLANWAGTGWKGLLKNKLEKDLLAWNSPNSENVRALSKRYLGQDRTTHWHWERTTTTLAVRRLDALIRLRGQVVHHGREAFNRTASIQRKQVVEASSLLNHLVECTEHALGIGPRDIDA